MLLQATPFLQQDELKQMLSSVFRVLLFFSSNEASFCPPVKHSCDPINLRGGLWGCEMRHPARMPLARLACSPPKDYPASLATGERRWARCQELFQQKFRKKILRSAESPDFQPSLSRFRYIATMQAHTGYPSELIFCLNDTLP